MTVTDERPERDPYAASDPDLTDDQAYQSDPEEGTETEATGRSRPRLAVIISAILLLALIGTSLAFLVPSNPAREAEQSLPTTPPAVATPVPGLGEQPTEMPLPAATGEYSSTEVIAEVGDGAVIRGDFVRLYQPGADPAMLLNQLIQIELVLQAAAAEGVSADPALIDEQINEIKQGQAGGDDALFLAFLDQVQVGDEANLRRLLERDQIVERMILKHTTVEQARARHILISREPDSDDAALRAEAEDLLSQIQGGADFAALAVEHSDDPGSGAEGGELGWAPRGLFVAPFDEAVFSMDVGELRLVETDFGFHIIELLEAPQLRSLDDPNLLQSMPGQQAFAASFIPWVEALQSQAEQGEQIKIVIPADQLVSMPAGT
jgi:peptidyl-prolyl cis-trans isomerase C